MDSLEKIVPFNQRLWIEKYIDQHPGALAGPFLLNEFYNTRILDTSMLYWQNITNGFSDSAILSIYYTQIVETVENLIHIKPGTLAPDFTLLQPDKKKFTLSSTRGSYVLIDFWASWCVPCRAAIPKWKKLYATYKKNGFTIISVADDRNWEDWQKPLTKEQMPWIQVVDEYPDENSGGLVGRLFEHGTIPFYILLDKEGKVVLSTSNGDDMAKKIEEVYK